MALVENESKTYYAVGHLLKWEAFILEAGIDFRVALGDRLPVGFMMVYEDFAEAQKAAEGAEIIELSFVGTATVLEHEPPTRTITARDNHA